MTTAFLSPTPVFRAVDNNGNALVGGLLYTYAAGSSTPIATYTDSTGATPNANPIVLNGRGECGIWLIPNVVYKFVLNDSAGNLIWSIDQITNSQLITLYAGVDSGIANAYVVNFTANFTTLTDGIVLYFIPANTSTGPSTINVNGLGVAAIINQNGTALAANQIIANQVATIMYKGGNWLLIQGAAQGIVAYGGTDTGATNAYVLPMTNQYFSYTAGNVVYFIPSNTSTGASTVNIKGLGVKNIDGTGVNPGAIQAGVMAQLIYNGSTFTLINTTVISSSGSFTATAATGMTTTPAITIYYTIVGNMVTWMWGSGLSGTSNSTGFTITGMPRFLQDVSRGVTSCLLTALDSGNAAQAYLSFGNALGGQTVTVNINNNSTNWTNSGTKALMAGTFTYIATGRAT